jgi:hypothetical protein
MDSILPLFFFLNRNPHRGFGRRNLKKSDHLEDVGLDGRIILKYILKKQDERAWTGFTWFRMGRNGVLL